MESHLLCSFCLKRLLFKDFPSGVPFLIQFLFEKGIFFKDVYSGRPFLIQFLFENDTFLKMFFSFLPFNSFICRPKSQQTVGISVHFSNCFRRLDFCAKTDGKWLLFTCNEWFFYIKCSFSKTHSNPYSKNAYSWLKTNHKIVIFILCGIDVSAKTLIFSLLKTQSPWIWAPKGALSQSHLGWPRTPLEA